MKSALIFLTILYYYSRELSFEALNFSPYLSIDSFSVSFSSQVSFPKIDLLREKGGFDDSAVYYISGCQQRKLYRRSFDSTRNAYGRSRR